LCDRPTLTFNVAPSAQETRFAATYTR
jgi:hypothetical protein